MRLWGMASTRATRRSAAAAASNPDDPQSTGSVLGELIKDFDLDRDLPLIENLDPDYQGGAQQAEQQGEGFINIVGAEQQQEIQNVSSVNDLDLKQEFLLVDEQGNETALPPPPPQHINFTITPQLPATTAEEENKPVVDKEGEQIMTSLHGFGQLAGVGSPFDQQQQQQQQQQQAHSPGGDQMMQQQQPPQQMDYSGAYVKILEQPLENKLRFRYECEGRSAGTMHGQSSTADNKTYPTIQIVNYQGPAVCVVSLVEHNSPYRAHPNNLVGRDGLCKKGVCSVEITNPNMTYQFQNLGIQCVRKKDAPASLDQRKEIRVDPFKQGFEHKNAAIDLNQVRLCFQVFLKTPDRSLIPLRPVVSSILKDRKAHADLGIIEYSDDRASVEGGKKILLFCEKISRDDIEVHFTQYTKGGEQITAKGEFSPTDVHKQFGICLKTPPYINKDITSPVKCSMYLYKPKSKAASEPVDFYYMPTAMDLKPPLPVTSARSPQHQQHQPQQASKRGRAPRHSPDEHSSGQVAVPSKQPQPQVMRQSGGTAVLIGSAGNNGMFTQQQQQQGFVGQMAYDQGGQQATAPANELQNLLEGGFVAPEQQHIFQAPRAAAAASAAPTNSNGGGGGNSSVLSDFLQNVTTTDGEALPNLSFVSGDLGGGGEMVDNLSANLDSNLKLNNGEKQQQQPKNDLDAADMPAAQQQQQHQMVFNRQSSQLHTPDVSSMSVDGPSGAAKRNQNVNKF